MSSTLYDDDIYLWSREQAEILRDLGSRRGELPNRLDLENIAEEIESVGRSDLRAVEGHLVQLMMHLIKLAVHGFEAEPARSWAKEIIAFHDGAVRRFTPGMRQSIDVAVLWADAIGGLSEESAPFKDPAPPVPADCPFSLDELLARPIRITPLVARITGADRGG